MSNMTEFCVIKTQMANIMKSIFWCVTYTQGGVSADTIDCVNLIQNRVNTKQSVCSIYTGLLKGQKYSIV